MHLWGFSCALIFCAARAAATDEAGVAEVTLLVENAPQVLHFWRQHDVPVWASILASLAVPDVFSWRVADFETSLVDGGCQGRVFSEDDFSLTLTGAVIGGGVPFEVSAASPSDCLITLARMLQESAHASTALDSTVSGETDSVPQGDEMAIAAVNGSLRQKLFNDTLAQPMAPGLVSGFFLRESVYNIAEYFRSVEVALGRLFFGPDFAAESPRVPLPGLGYSVPVKMPLIVVEENGPFLSVKGARDDRKYTEDGRSSWQGPLEKREHQGRQQRDHRGKGQRNSYSQVYDQDSVPRPFAKLPVTRNGGRWPGNQKRLSPSLNLRGSEALHKKRQKMSFRFPDAKFTRHADWLRADRWEILPVEDTMRASMRVIQPELKVTLNGDINLNFTVNNLGQDQTKHQGHFKPGLSGAALQSRDTATEATGRVAHKLEPSKTATFYKRFPMQQAVNGPSTVVARLLKGGKSDTRTTSSTTSSVDTKSVVMFPTRQSDTLVTMTTQPEVAASTSAQTLADTVAHQADDEEEGKPLKIFSVHTEIPLTESYIQELQRIAGNQSKLHVTAYTDEACSSWKEARPAESIMVVCVERVTTRESSESQSDDVEAIDLQKIQEAILEASQQLIRETAGRSELLSSLLEKAADADKSTLGAELSGVLDRSAAKTAANVPALEKSLQNNTTYRIALD